jgi:hypothetical protein
MCPVIFTEIWRSTKLLIFFEDAPESAASVINVFNAFKYALRKLDFDTESVVLKVYSNFSSSATRKEDLKGFVDISEMEREELVKHVP